MEFSLLMDQVELLYNNFGPAISFLASFIEISPLGFLIPGVYLLAIGGFFAFGKNTSLINLILAGTIGAWLIFTIAYLLGFKTGNFIIKKFKQEKKAKLAHFLLKKHGVSILLTSLMSPPVRFWVAYIAGVDKYSPFKFILYSGLVSFSWVGLWTLMGFIVGSLRLDLEKNLARFGLVGWGFILLSVFIFYWNLKRDLKDFKNKNENSRN